MNESKTTKPTILEAAEKMNEALLACADEGQFLSVGTAEKVKAALKTWHGLKYGKN